MATKLYASTTDETIRVNGVAFALAKGTVLAEGHPAVKARRDLFEPVGSGRTEPSDEEPRVEETTARPGEKRRR